MFISCLWHVPLHVFPPASLYYLYTALKNLVSFGEALQEDPGKTHDMRIGSKYPIMSSHIHIQGPRSDTLIQPSVPPLMAPC